MLSAANLHLYTKGGKPDGKKGGKKGGKKAAAAAGAGSPGREFWDELGYLLKVAVPVWMRNRL